MDLFSTLQSWFGGEDAVDLASRFELRSEAISGTMSQFHKARDIKTGQIVGLKILDGEKTDAFESRFVGMGKPSEGEIASSLVDKRIVTTLEFGTAKDGRQFIVMEYLDGLGLNTLIQQRAEALVPKRLNLIRQSAEALRVVHDAGYIHRDVCPRNYIASRDLSGLKLIDFGLTLPATSEYNQPGNRTGLPSYMAPEIVRRRPTDHRVDIFAWGATVYHLLAFELPWPGDDVTGKAAMRHDTEAPVDLLSVRPDLDSRLAALVMRCLEREPGQRPESMEAILRDLRRVPQETAG